MQEHSQPADTVELHGPHTLLPGDSANNGYPDTNGRSVGSDVPPQHAVSALPAWNQNKADVYKTLSTFVALFIMGANDAAYGVSCPFGRVKKYILT